MQNKTLEETNNKISWAWLRGLIKVVEDCRDLEEIKDAVKDGLKTKVKEVDFVINDSDKDETVITEFVEKNELSHDHLEKLVMQHEPCKISRLEYIFPLEASGRSFGLLKIKLESNFDADIKSLFWGFADAIAERINTFVLYDANLKHQVKDTSFSIFNNMKGFLEASLERLKSVEDQNKQLIKINEARTELINNVSHELRTPLVSIMGFSKLLQRREIEQNLVLEASEQIQSAGSRLSRMIDDLIQLNRAGTQGWQVNVERLDIGEIARIVVESISSLNKNHRFTFNYPDDYPVIDGDRKLLRQVIENLLLNAIKYSPDGGEINLSISLEDDNLRFSVRDEGIGMTTEEKSKIFDRFYRAKNQKTENIAGLGLGLSICKDVIEALKGSIECESEYGKGSTFTINMKV